jgi:hypothetical protein
MTVGLGVSFRLECPRMKEKRATVFCALVLGIRMTTVDFRGCGHGTASTETGPNSRRVKLRRPTFTPVRRVLRSGATSFEYERDIQPRPKLGRWTEDLDALLAGNSAKPSREQLTLIWIFEGATRTRLYPGFRHRMRVRAVSGKIPVRSAALTDVGVSHGELLLICHGFIPHLEPIQEVRIQEQRVGLARRLSMMRIMARRTNAAVDWA